MMSQNFQIKTGYQTSDSLDVTALLDKLNVKMQCKGLFVHQMYSAVKTFLQTLELLLSQVMDNVLTHFPKLKEAKRSSDGLKKYSTTLKALHGEFSKRF